MGSGRSLDRLSVWVYREPHPVDALAVGLARSVVTGEAVDRPAADGELNLTVLAFEGADPPPIPKYQRRLSSRVAALFRTLSVKNAGANPASANAWAFLTRFTGLQRLILEPPMVPTAESIWSLDQEDVEKIVNEAKKFCPTLKMVEICGEVVYSAEE